MRRSPPQAACSSTDLRPHREVRSYVLRGGRITASQQRALDLLWPRYGIERPNSSAVDFTALFGRKAPLVLEIGFGMGDSLLNMAKASPQQNFVGIEVHRPGVGRLLHLIDQEGLTNIRVFCDDAVDVLNHCIADASVHRVQLFFPDPWHKKRHHKRRIVQPAFAHLVLQKLEPQGVFHAATDWENYAEHILAVFEQANGMINLAGSGQYADKPHYRPDTKFEQRGERLGHSVRDLLFVKTELDA